MSILVVGVNHRSGPLALLERLTVAPDLVGKSVAGLALRDDVREAALLSTCNRTELYATVADVDVTLPGLESGYFLDRIEDQNGSGEGFLYRRRDGEALDLRLHRDSKRPIAAADQCSG